MSRREAIAAAISAVVGSLLSTGLAALRETNATLWLAAIIGGAVGMFCGLFGGNRIEGCLIAVVSVVTAVLIVTLVPWPWVREVGIGWCVGAGVGSFAHGIASR